MVAVVGLLGSDSDYLFVSNCSDPWHQISMAFHFVMAVPANFVK